MCAPAVPCVSRRLLLVLLVDLVMACVLQYIVARGGGDAELEMEPLASTYEDGDGYDDGYDDGYEDEDGYGGGGGYDEDGDG